MDNKIPTKAIFESRSKTLKHEDAMYPKFDGFENKQS